MTSNVSVAVSNSCAFVFLVRASTDILHTSTPMTCSIFDFENHSGVEIMCFSYLNLYKIFGPSIRNQSGLIVFY